MIFSHIGCILAVIVIRSRALLSASPSLIIPTGFARFCCDNGNVNIEWLDSNLDVLTATSRVRIKRMSMLLIFLALDY